MTYVSLQAPSVLVIGHRGASAARPENTVEAFRHAAALGADWVELDVRRTADDHLAVHHDAVLPDGRAIVEVAAADLPPSLPSLAEALDACAGMGVNIEIKNDRHDPDFDPDDRVAIAVAELLSGATPALPTDRVLVSSFNPSTIGLVHDRAPHVPTGRLTANGHDLSGRLERTAAAGHTAINPFDELVDHRLVEQAHDAGLLVYVWTVDDADRMRALVGLGVDGIITNVPDVARAAVGPRSDGRSGIGDP
jgi:glycerophosphoryl diester phosphodiesterase